MDDQATATIDNGPVIILEDWVVKSPPYEKMKNFASYCKRWMALIKIGKKYLKKVEGKKGTLSSPVDNKNDSIYCLCYWNTKEDSKKKPKRKKYSP